MNNIAHLTFEFGTISGRETLPESMMNCTVRNLLMTTYVRLPLVKIV